MQNELSIYEKEDIPNFISKGTYIFWFTEDKEIVKYFSSLLSKSFSESGLVIIAQTGPRKHTALLLATEDIYLKK